MDVGKQYLTWHFNCVRNGLPALFITWLTLSVSKPYSRLNLLVSAGKKNYSVYPSIDKHISLSIANSLYLPVTCLSHCAMCMCDEPRRW